MKKAVIIVTWALSIFIALIIGRYYPKYYVFFCGHGSDILVGLLTGVLVSVGGGIVSKLLSEKKDLVIASQEYGRYCGRICSLLNMYKEDSEKISSEILNLIREDPFYFGFCFTDSKALAEMNKILENIEYDIMKDKLDNRKAYSYSADLFRIRLNIISVKYKFYFLGKKRLVKQTIKKDENGNIYVEEKYRR